MARTRPNILEQFLMLFNAVKRAAGNEPSRLATFYQQHQTINTAVNEFYTFMSRGDFERRVFHAPKKYHPQTPAGFERAFKDYKDNWELPIAACLNHALLELLEMDFGEGEADKAQSIDAQEVYVPDPNLEDSFDPLLHDGGKALPMAFWAAERLAEDIDVHADTINYASKIGLEAYDYLVGAIGLDVEAVFRRWRAVPPIFMPAHVSNAHGMTERGSLYDLIDDAVRAYVFGAPAAAIAACRAALEMILKLHYEIDYQFKDREGRIRDKGLGELIILADEKYAFIQGKRLERLTNDANNVIHNYSRRNRLSEADERTILEFMKTIKFLIERAPA